MTSTVPFPGGEAPARADTSPFRTGCDGALGVIAEEEQEWADADAAYLEAARNDPAVKRLNRLALDALGRHLWFLCREEVAASLPRRSRALELLQSRGARFRFIPVSQLTWPVAA